MQGVLDDQEAQLQGVLAAARMATWHEDAETGVAVTSGTMAELVGLLLGNHLKTRFELSQVIHPEDVERYDATVDAAVQSGNAWQVEFRVIRPRDGKTVWLEERGKVVRDPATGKVALEGLTEDLTERKHAEAALRDSEARFRRLSESGIVGIACFHTGGAIMEANDAFLKTLGATREDLRTGKVRWDADTPEGWLSRTRQASEELRETGYFTPYEKEFVRADGTRRWGLFGGAILGKAETGIGIVLDVTDRKQAEEALRESEGRWRLIVESARDFAIFSLDSQGLVTSWNAGAQAILGYAEPEMIGRSGDVIFTPEDRASGQPQREIEWARRDGRAEDERWHLHKDGRRFWGSGVLTSMRGPDGQVVGFLKILRDLTAVRQAQEAHRQAEERFRLFVGSLQDYAIFLLDPQGCVTSWNPGAQRITGYAEAEVIGRHVSLFYPPEALAEGLPEREMVTALAQGRTENDGWRLRKRGERLWVNEVMVRLPQPHEGPAAGFAKIWRDLTERKAAEDERARLLAEAEAANRAKDRFLAALSHELRTPLTPVRMALFSFQCEGQLSAAAREALAMMDRNLELERQLIDDLLDVSRIAHGKLDVQRAPVDVHASVRAALEVCRGEAAAKGLQLTIELAAASPMVLGDGPRLQQVFWNLVQNATKFTPEGGAITVRSRDLADGGVAVDVADNGVGIAPEFLPKLFDPFEQGSAEVGRRHSGLGLGLAISQAIVQAHGGRLTAASAGRGQGATFTVQLPAPPRTDAGGAAPPTNGVPF